MKTYKIIKAGIFGALVIVMFTSCNHQSENINKEEFSAFAISVEEQQRLDSLERIYISTLDEIDSNLDEIRDKYGILVLGPTSNMDLGIEVKDQIINNISAINNLLAVNKDKITELENSLIRYKRGKKELIKSIEVAKQRVEEQNKSIEILKSELLKKDFKIEELNKTVAEMDNSISRLNYQNEIQKAQINRKYFVYGTKRELKKKKVVQNGRGILIVTESVKINPDCNNDEFTSLNMYEQTEITLTGKKPKLLTTHPVGSYAFVDENSNDNQTLLQINNPDNFWKNSNYLIVQVK